MSAPAPGPGSTRVYGIIGWPLRHTLSPAILGGAFRAVGLDAAYVPFPVPPGRLPEAIAGVRALGVRGVNVTAPHKEEAARLVDALDDAGIGAVNTLALDEGRAQGHNTDTQAFGEFLAEDARFDVRGRSVLLLGAGGAARACAVALGERGAARVVVAARRRDAARAVAGLAAGVPEVLTAGFDEAGPLSPEADLLVNATPLGWEEEEVPLRPRAGQVAVDLVYRPTPFLAAAAAAGAEAHDGLRMLIRQAALAFRIWTGMPPPIAAMARAAEDARAGST